MEKLTRLLGIARPSLSNRSPDGYGFAMLAIGCLLLIVLPIMGLALGGVVAGPVGARWGAGMGLAIAVGVAGISVVALARLKSR